MSLRLAKLQKSDNKAWKIQAEGLDEYKDVDRVMHHQGLAFISEIIRTKLISRHHNKLLAGHFSIDKSRELISRKYF